MKVRTASVDDAQPLMELRNWYIANSVAAFDETPFSREAIQDWLIRFTSSAYRLFVAECEDRILGYCCSQQYRSHPAFSKTVETIVYVQPDTTGSGVGSALYRELFNSLANGHFHRAVVGIALPNDGSIRLHEKFGFRKVGVFSEYACKWGQAISSQWMERAV